MRERFMYALRTVLCASAVACAGVVPAAAQDAGVRAGVSVNPDQFYFGGHIETKPLVDRLRFRPNGDSDLEGGLNFLVGVQHRDGLFVEFKVGAIDSPDIKFGVGFTWR